MLSLPEFLRNPNSQSITSPFPIICVTNSWTASIKYPQPFHPQGAEYSPSISCRPEGAELQPFYKNILSYRDTTTAETEQCSNAVVVPYEKLGLLRKVLPDLRIGNYESVEDFWGLELSKGCFSPRKKYHTVVDLCNDKKLWESSESIKLFDGDVETTAQADCIIFAQCGSVEDLLTRELARHMWLGSTGEPGFWDMPGMRGNVKLVDPKILFSDFLPTCSACFPVYDKTNMDKMMRYVQRAASVLEYLQATCNGCGWFTGTPAFFVLACPQNGPRRNVLSDPGTEHHHVLPIDEQQLLMWLDDGSVERMKVAVVDADSRNTDANFTSKIYTKGINFRAYPNIEDAMLNFFHRVKAAKVVVFFCDDWDKSVAVAGGYLKWLRATRPDSLQQVRVLHRGKNALSIILREFRRFDEYLLSKHKWRVSRRLSA